MAERMKLSFLATTASKIDELPIVNGQFILIKDTNTIAVDMNDKRTKYEQIITLESDSDRSSILAPVNGVFYFVVETNSLWKYDQGWKMICSAQSLVPAGGSSGQVLTKQSDTNGDVSWQNPSVSDEQVTTAVNLYLEENPVSGMTAEQEQQLNQNTSDVSDLKSALPDKLDYNQGAENKGKSMVVGEDGGLVPENVKVNVDSTLSNEGEAADAKAVGLKKADTFYFKDSLLVNFGQKYRENECIVDFGRDINSKMDYEKILTEYDNIYVCVSAKEDYWNSGAALRLNLRKSYDQAVTVLGNDILAFKGFKSLSGEYIFAYIKIECDKALTAIREKIEENSYEDVYGFSIVCGQVISRYNTPWYIGVTVEEPTEDVFNNDFKTERIDPYFITAVGMALETDNEEEMPDFSPMNGKYGLHIGDSYTYAMAKTAEESGYLDGAFIALDKKMGMAGGLNYGIASSTIRDGSNSQGYDFQPMVSRVCHKSTGTTSDYFIPLDRDDIGYITFMGGTNDSAGIESSVGSNIYDGESCHIYGAMHQIMETLLASYPGIPIIVILQPCAANNENTENPEGVDISELSKPLKSVLVSQRKQKAVKEVVELYAKSYENVRVVDCCFNWYSPLISEDLEIIWSDDLLHLTSTGCNEITEGTKYDSVYKAMSSIFAQSF